MNKHVIRITLLLVMTTLLGGCQSYEKKIEKYTREANEFKKSLPNNADILCEIIDSVATKIYYKEDGNTSSILAYDIANHSTATIKIEMPYGYQARRYHDRLFIIAETGAIGSSFGEQQRICYINMRDNSVHHVLYCEDAEFLDNGLISVTRAFVIDESGPTCDWEWKDYEYSLSTSMTDAEYSSCEKQQEEKEKAMAKEERNKTKEIHLHYSITYDDYKHVGTSHSGRFHDYHTIYGWGPGGCGITTENITVPYGKIWTLKNIESTNARGLTMIYMENESGNRYKYSERVNTHGTILYGGQTFRIGFDVYGGTHDYSLDIYFIETRDATD